ncbi:MAG: lytic transglycosylase domain-containing protein [Clostridia bacterium]|nr:lytic transglycosylase domain-containing protein [Clostridia bacterium]
MRLTVKRLLIFLLIALLSVGFGFGYDAAATAIEKHRYPQPQRFSALICEQAEAFGVPANVIFAVVRNESDFVSDALSEDGAVGLMQITPSLMETVYTEILREPIPDAGILYDPKTNLRVGTAWLSRLYQNYGVWDTVYAAWHAGESVVDAWLLDENNLNGQGQLTNIPHRETAKFVSRTKKSAEMYAKLYSN